jgi:limonene-1,2-epoxide hydrolase
MHRNEVLIHNFFTAFSEKDYRTMQGSYAADATFSDPVFQNLNVAEVQSMWEMFCKRGKDLQLNFEILSVNENQVIAEWIPRYTFSATGKHVVNHITSTFVIVGDKIIKQTDNFNLYRWTSQALGVKGMLFGWSSFMQNKIRKTAMGNLHKFMLKSAN